MGEVSKRKKQTKSQLVTRVLAGIFTVLFVGVVGWRWYIFSKEPVDYKLGEIIFSLPNNESQYRTINDGQIINITKDGISAYDLEGNEIWTDTLSLKIPVVRQKDPYIVVGDKGEDKITIFSSTGKEGEIVGEGPIHYFGINENGDIATIEETGEGHTVSAYTKEGKRIPGKRITSTKTGGFPLSAYIAEERDLMLITYVDTLSSVVTSNLAAMYLDVEVEQAVDNIQFGIEEKNNLVYEVTSLGDGWVTIGDTFITFYDKQGIELKQIESRSLQQTPYVHAASRVSYLPVLADSLQGDDILYGKQSLTSYDEKGEIIFRLDFSERIDYFYPDDQGIIVGSGRTYQGFDLKGRLVFTLHATQDIEAIRIVDNKPIAITKNQVISLEKIKEED